MGDYANAKTAAGCLFFTVLVAALSILCYSWDLGLSKADCDGIGQVKYVETATPLTIDNYKLVDISLGVMQNGQGSVSTRDMAFEVMAEDDYKLLTEASKTGDIVRFKYNVRRWRWQMPNAYITHVELVKKAEK